MTSRLRLAVSAATTERAGVADLFHRLNRILPRDQEVVTVPPDTSVGRALAIMRRHGFSQLPVSEAREVLGVFSYRSLVKTMQSIDLTQHDLFDVPVEETMEFIDPTWFAHVNHELAHILDTLDQRDAVLIGEPSRLQGILTTVDVLRYLNVVAGRFVALGEIELCIRALFRAVFNDEQIAEAAQLILQRYSAAKRPTSVEEMTFGDYEQLVGDERLWSTCRLAFGGDRDRTRLKFRSLRMLRNDVFHFRRELTEDDDRDLRSHRDWLLMRARMLDARAAEGGSHE